MHPDPAFRIDAAACRALVRRVAFAHIFICSGERPAVVHAPCVLDGDDRLTFHVSRRNHALALLDGAVAIASFVATDGYVSPDWYDGAGQVPTWNYLSAEAEGTVSAMTRAELVAQVEALSAEHERRLLPKPMWTRDKMPPGRFDAMVGAIEGFAINVATWRGTAKLSQNKPVRDVAGVIDGLRGAGADVLAALVEETKAG